MSHLLNILVFIPLLPIWILVVYQLVLTINGLIYYRKSLRERREILLDLPPLPPVTILIPAHNEEKVIERTVRSMLALEYTPGRLQVMVINDASDDATGQILDRLAAEDDRVRVLHRARPEGGTGKSAALNAAMKLVENEYIAIYDADNCPEPNALKLLIAQFLVRPELGAVVGKFRTGNKTRNLLTRFINIEGLGFQGTMQAGRSQLMGIATLSGTNYVIRRSVVAALGGWDVEALTEDQELSVRMYQAGYRVGYVPYSSSWEQEPETFSVWLKQRTRWARGNNYAFVKLLRTFGRSRSKLVALELLYVLSIPYCLLFALVLSQIIVISSLLGGDIMLTSGIPNWWWYIAVGLYYSEVVVVLGGDKELTPLNMATTLLMYFTYCQAWPLAYIRALYSDVIRRESRTWYKTVRFDIAPDPNGPATNMFGDMSVGKFFNQKRALTAGGKQNR